jgi:hypothetical protein
VEEVDKTVDTEGYITTINLVGLAITATATAGISSGYVKEIFLNNDGSGYSSTPTVTISPPESGTRATAVAITTSVSGVKSVEKIVLINAGSGYLSPPTISITGGGGTGAAATCSIGATTFGVSSITISDGGSGYSTIPQVIISPPTGVGETATAIALIDTDYRVSEIRIVNAGYGYTEAPGDTSDTQARVKKFVKRFDINENNPPIELQVSINTGKFYPGEVLVGTISSSRYIIQSYDTNSYNDSYDSNEEIQIAADSIIDFSESNPFGDY